jgi:hypothetical protein
VPACWVCDFWTNRSRWNYVIVLALQLVYIAAMNLRDEVEALLPNWERWYPSLFDAASDLGVIRAEVCDPDSLNLNRRHAKVRQRAKDAHLEKWGGKPQE